MCGTTKANYSLPICHVSPTCDNFCWFWHMYIHFTGIKGVIGPREFTDDYTCAWGRCYKRPVPKYDQELVNTCDVIMESFTRTLM